MQTCLGKQIGRQRYPVRFLKHGGRGLKVSSYTGSDSVAIYTQITSYQYT